MRSRLHPLPQGERAGTPGGSRPPLAWAALVLLAAAGCDRNPRAEDFVPPEEAARAALDAYLRAWAAGSTADPVPGTRPPVQVADELRSKGRTLSGYTILGPTPADAPRCFAVQLKLGNPPAEVRERYVVVGIDPVWVWRYDDYLMITRWEHPVPADGKAAKPAKR
ncbi:MAG: hypothetical protein K2X87_28230 [Gemmataceae bacterium]|nr:hypothetical protein [Gemmataceae bacterium]